jgi:hypothetical protein
LSHACRRLPPFTALGWLAKRKLIDVARASVTAVPVYTVLRPWRRHH